MFTATAYFFRLLFTSPPSEVGWLCASKHVSCALRGHTHPAPAPPSLADLATAIPHGAKRQAEPQPNRQTVSETNQ